MDILITGSGGREHALVHAISKSPLADRIFCAPGNAGTANLAECVDIKATDIPGLVAFAQEKGIDLTVVGPEKPLISGIVDAFDEAGLPIFGPTKAAAMIEGSKVFAKQLMAQYGIPTAPFRVFDQPIEAEAYIDSLCRQSDTCAVVVKADGDALGKGVFVCHTRKQTIEAINTIMVAKAFGSAGDRIVIEDRLYGQEASFIVITDVKRARSEDRGPNTGGMGSFSPVPMVTPILFYEVMDRIIKPTLEAMTNQGCPFKGALYAGVILTKDGPQVLEFNCRFGDPETQAVLPLLETDFLEILLTSTEGCPGPLRPTWSKDHCVCVVAASGGYPGDYKIGKVISGLDKAEKVDGVTIFHAGTRTDGGQIVTNGGRVLGLTAIGKTVSIARSRAYTALDYIKFKGMQCRDDIAWRAAIEG